MSATAIKGAVLALALAGCATGPYAVTVRSARAPACDARIEALARALPYSTDYPVRVVAVATLDGTRRDARGRLVVPLEAMGRYRYLGEIESARASPYPAQAFASVLWMPRMHETTDPALRAFCWAQAPLRALTLGAWSVLAPTSWPCFALYGDDETIHLAELRRAAFAMGANTLLLATRENELVQLRKSRRIVSTGPRALEAYAFIDTWAPPAVVGLDDAAADRLVETAAACWRLPASVRVVRPGHGAAN
jgi:hypothetical protein